MPDHICQHERELGELSSSMADMEECKFPKLNQRVEKLEDRTYNPTDGVQRRLTKVEDRMDAQEDQTKILRENLEKIPKQIIGWLGLLMGILIIIASASFYLVIENNRTLTTHVEAALTQGGHK